MAHVPFRAVFRAGWFWAMPFLSLQGLGAEPQTDWDRPASEILSRSVKTIPAEMTAITTAPFRHPKETGWTALGILALVAVDHPTTKFLQTHVEPNLTYRWAGPSFGSRHIGGADGYLVAAIPAFYLGSLTLGHGRGQAAALLSVKAGAYAFLYAHLVGKTLTGRNRPNPDLASGGTPEAPYTNSPWDWGHLHRPYVSSQPDGTAFPSFHYTLYFAVASVFHRVYDNAWLPYLVAGAGLGAEFKGHHHWVSDAVSGAVLGMALGRVVVGEYKQHQDSKKTSWQLSLTPSSGPGPGLALRLMW